MTIDLASVRRAYHRHAPYYDAVFGTLLGRGRKRAVAYANRLGRHDILEVGVGTGLSLPLYRSDTRITGIDVSPEMLDRAHQRVEARGLDHVKGLYEMDAEALEFAENSFDLVAAMFVASVVPHPGRLVSEMKRVCIAGGDILIVNHFAEEEGLRGLVERALAPLSRDLGWRPDFLMSTLLENSGLEVLGVIDTDPFGMFKIVHCRNGE